MPSPKTPVRYSGGVTNVGPGDAWYMIGVPDPTKNHVFFKDFEDYNANEWVITLIGAGGTVTTGTSSDGGALVVTTDAGVADSVVLQWSGVDQTNVNRTFRHNSGRPLAYKVRFKVDNVVLPDVLHGLSVLDTTPIATSGANAAFRMSAGSAVVNFVVTNVTELVVQPIYTMVNDTFVELGYYWTGDKFEVFVNGVKVYTTASLTLTQDAVLCPTLALRNSTAVARVMTTDYIAAALPRNLY